MVVRSERDWLDGLRVLCGWLFPGSFDTRRDREGREGHDSRWMWRVEIVSGCGCLDACSVEDGLLQKKGAERGSRLQRRERKRERCSES
jgi:hypothetical protein